MNEHDILIKETIEEVNMYLPKMIKGINKYVEYILTSKEEQDCKNLLTQIFEGLEWVVQAIFLINKIKKCTMKEQDLVEKLPMLIDAYENEDYVLVSDILDYEIKPILEKWANQIH